MPTIKIRPLCPQDTTAAVVVFHDAIMNGTADVYSKAERIAWAGKEPDVVGWKNRFDGVNGIAAVTDDQLIGFMTIDDTGYIDLAFVRPDRIGESIGSLLYAEVVRWGLDHGISQLTTDASLKARPFFERHGWSVIADHTVLKKGARLRNHKMKIDL